jgi:hypothetical protein
MQQHIVTVEVPSSEGVGPVTRSPGTNSMLPALFAIAGQALQSNVAERQLASVIHQLCWNEKARRKLLLDPEAFIAGLKVLPQVKAVLGLMKATLLAGRLMTPEFNWWWGRADPGAETDETPTGPERLDLALPAPQYALAI